MPRNYGLSEILELLGVRVSLVANARFGAGAPAYMPWHAADTVRCNLSSAGGFDDGVAQTVSR